MRYWYKIADMWAATPKEKDLYYHGEPADAYWTAEDVRKIPLYEETPEILKDYADNEMSVWMPMFDNENDWRTWETDYKNRDAAYKDMKRDFNQAIYELRMDI